MMRYMILTLCSALLFVNVAMAAPNDLAVEIAYKKIGITVGFDGSSVELFGDRRDAETQVAIVVEGPRKDITIWQKVRIFGAWVNRYFIEYDSTPTFYHYALSDVELLETHKELLLQNGIGYDGLFHARTFKKSNAIKNEKVFHQALLKKQRELGVYYDEPEVFTFLTPNFFRVHFDIPSSAPTGEYKILTYLIKGGKVIERRENVLQVRQVGLNSFIYQSAQDYALLYALVCLALAFFSGWIVNVLKIRP